MTNDFNEFPPTGHDSSTSGSFDASPLLIEISWLQVLQIFSTTSGECYCPKTTSFLFGAPFILFCFGRAVVHGAYYVKEKRSGYFSTLNIDSHYPAPDCARRIASLLQKIHYLRIFSPGKNNGNFI
jgi:hypothetical protein